MDIFKSSGFENYAQTFTLGLETQDVLDFLELADTYGERDLEKSILNTLEKFIPRQKRITPDNIDYYTNLVFYHRKLRCFVVIDLKMGKFGAEYKGQMELYLKYLEKYKVNEGENSPIGIILCTEKGKEQIELLFLPGCKIKIVEYLTKLPLKELFVEKLHKVMLTTHVKQRFSLPI